jgi:hypothetical protein
VHGSRSARPARSLVAFVLPLIAVSCLAEAAHAAAKPGVTGKFVIAGKPLTLREVAAFRKRDGFNPRQWETYVVVSAKAVDKAALADSLDPYAVVINDPAVSDANYLGFSVSANGEIDMNARYEGTQYIDSSGKIMGQTGSLVATCSENSATRVACTVKTAKPVQSMDGPEWSMDLSFETDVLSRPAGTPTPADGGDAGKAFLALRKALAGNDLAKILALMTPDQGSSYQADWRSAAENLADAKDILDVRLPKKPKITGGEQLAADHVLLEIEGEPYEDGKMLYVVEMKKLDGKWVYADANILGILR